MRALAPAAVAAAFLLTGCRTGDTTADQGAPAVFHRPGTESIDI